MFKSYSDIFSQRADLYHQAMSQWPGARDQEFKQVVSRTVVNPGDKICDLPSGGGYLWHYLPTQNIRYTAVETSEYFYQSCAQDERRDRIRAELYEIPVNANCFDILFSITGLHHIENRAPVYQEFYRILKPGGKVVIAEVKKDTPVGIFLNGAVDRLNSMGHEGLFLCEKDLSALQETGLIITDNQFISYPWSFETVEDMTRYCRLLFGLDKANDRDLEREIRNVLGYTESGNQIDMSWGLQFLTLQKPEKPV